MDEVDDDLAEPRLVAADRREARRDVDDEAQALALGEEPEPLGRVRGDPPEVDVVEQDSGPPPSIRARSSSSLTIWTRWPVSTSILPIRSRIRGGHGVAGRLGVAGQRLGEEADRRERRPQLVREVVDELGPDLLEPAQLRDVLEHDPHAAERRAPRPDDEDRAVGPLSRNSPDAPPVCARRRDQVLDPGVDERLERRPPAQRAGGRREEQVGRRVRQLDPPSSSRRTMPTPMRSAR